MAEIFHELRGDYVENTGQELSLREYLDYFEPLGSALARMPDGVGGPFVHHFTDGGGRTIGALGWVVSAKSKRFGGWKLWGMWSDRAMPAIALPLLWPVLADPERTSEFIARANDDAELLVDPDRWSELFETLKTTRLRDSAFREYLKAELARAYAIPLPHRHPIEVELTPRMLDLLPWLYLLGPVDPAAARLQPNRFNGAGYQYILSDDLPALSDAEIPREVDSIVDTAAKNIAAGWRLAGEFRARRERPPRSKPPVKPAKPRERERNDMRSAPSHPPTPPPRPRPAMPVPWTLLYRLAVLALLGWIGWNVQMLRKAPPQPAAPAVTAAQDEPTDTVAPVYEPDLSSTRIRRIAAALAARPPRGIRVSDSVLNGITAGELAHVSVEIFLRRNRCFTGNDAIDGKFSAAEQRAIRNCSSLDLMKDRTTPDTARAVQWLEDTVVP